MSRKHNARHPERGRSRYPERLKRRGLSTRGARMTPLTDLRRMQGRPDLNASYPVPVAGR